MMKVDYLIAGQGIAGSILGYELQKQNKKIFLLDNNYPNSSSRIAAGLFNPVTGRKMVHTWLADELFKLIHSYYPRLENELQNRFFHPLPLLYLFSSVKEQNDLVTKFSNPVYADWADVTGNSIHPPPYAPLGFMELKQAGWCHVTHMLHAFQQFFTKQACLQQETFDYTRVRSTQTGWEYRGMEAKAIICCEGVSGGINPWFSYLPFKPVKGEILTFKSEKLWLKSIIKQHYWVIPTGEQLFRAGATFDFNRINEQQTAEARDELSAWLTKTIQVPFEITGHQAGIRPAVIDRRPLLGEHPKEKGLFIFNGFGAKGVTLIPYLAEKMVQFLLKGSLLPEETNINRF